MVGSTADQAVVQLAAPIQRALSAVTSAVLRRERDSPIPGQYTLSLAGGLAALRGPTPLRLFVAHNAVAEAIGGRRPRWTARTVGYAYTLFLPDSRALASYHWHSFGLSPITWPHLHTHGYVAPANLSKAHWPTGEIALAAVLRCAIQDLGVEPLRPDWQVVLGAAE